MADRILTAWKRNTLPQLGLDLDLSAHGEGQDVLHLPNGKDIFVHLVSKPRLRPALIPELQEEAAALRVGKEADAVLFVAPHVASPLAARLREEGIWFSDLMGNAYIQVPGQIFLYITGNRASAQSVADRGGWMTPHGARVLFQLLVRGPHIQATYRTLSEDARVSLGFVHGLMRKLIEKGTLVQQRCAEYTVADPYTLLDQWTMAFNEKLAPRIILGRFHGPFGDDLAGWLHAHAAGLASTTVSGEAAADLLTGYLRPRSARLYLPASTEMDVCQRLKLAPSSNGAITLCEAFAKKMSETVVDPGLHLAHPALVYAELMATDDRRLAETALRIRKEHLSWIE